MLHSLERSEGTAVPPKSYTCLLGFECLVIRIIRGQLVPADWTGVDLGKTDKYSLNTAPQMAKNPLHEFVSNVNRANKLVKRV